MLNPVILLKNTSQILTLALGNIFDELEDTILEEHFKMGRPSKPYLGETYRRAIMAGLIQGKPYPSSPNPRNLQATPAILEHPIQERLRRVEPSKTIKASNTTNG